MMARLPRRHAMCSGVLPLQSGVSAELAAPFDSRNLRKYRVWRGPSQSRTSVSNLGLLLQLAHEYCLLRHLCQ